jgi:uncharacterized protein with GYD domain
MAKFYLLGNYTAKAFQGFLADPDSDRGAAINAVASAVGGKVLGYDIVRGSYDFIVSIEAPNFESMAGCKTCYRSNWCSNQHIYNGIYKH